MMRWASALLLCCVAAVVSCGGSGMSAESVVWRLGTPVLSADETSFPMEVRITMAVSKHHDNRVEPAPDGTQVLVDCEFRSDGRVIRPHTQTWSGVAEIVIPFLRSDIADVTVSVENSHRDVTVEAMESGDVRLVGG